MAGPAFARLGGMLRLYLAGAFAAVSLTFVSSPAAAQTAPPVTLISTATRPTVATRTSTRLRTSTDLVPPTVLSVFMTVFPSRPPPESQAAP